MSCDKGLVPSARSQWSAGCPLQAIVAVASAVGLVVAVVVLSDNDSFIIACAVALTGVHSDPLLSRGPGRNTVVCAGTDPSSLESAHYSAPMPISGDDNEP